MLTAVTALVLAGCGGNDSVATSGTVNLVMEDGDPLVFVLSTDVAQDTLNNAIITVDARNLEGAEPQEVQRGDEVKVWVNICTSSIPPQCEATKVEVTGR